MYYDDENNMYHYSYRTPEEPTVRSASYREAEEKSTRKHMGLKIVALVLCCTLLGAAAGYGASMLSVRNGTAAGVATIYVSDRDSGEAQNVSNASGAEQTLSAVYDNVVESVVSINCSSTSVNAFGQRTQSASSGSGFVISAEGYVVTNCHVVSGATSVKVTFNDGDTYDASVIGSDEDYDIAVLKIEAEGLKSVVLGNSDALKVGDTIAAIGNPLGELTFSMSKGIVSSVGRTINVDGTPFSMIQVDCSINPGNSGGPLVDTRGEVVGIVSAKYMQYASATVEGIGFAIPINDVVAMIQDIMTNGYVTNKAYLGITAQTMNESMAQQYRYDVTSGVFVCSVDEGSGAQKAGLRLGDVIVKMDDHAITSMQDLTAVKKYYSAGDTVTLSVYRAGQTISVEVTLDAAPVEEETQQPSAQQPPMNNGGDDYYDYWNQFFGNMFGGFYPYQR